MPCSIVCLVILTNQLSRKHYGGLKVAPESQASSRSLPSAGPNLRSVSTPKIFICYMMHESTLSWHTTLHDPWPHLHRCNMTLAATIHFGLWSRFNEFLWCCACMSLALALSLVLLATSESWKYITWLSKANVFSHRTTRLWSQSSAIWRNPCSGSHILSLFVCFLNFKRQFQLDCDRFPTVHPGNQECRWTFESLSFINLDHMRRFGIVTI